MTAKPLEFMSTLPHPFDIFVRAWRRSPRLPSWHFGAAWLLALAVFVPSGFAAGAAAPRDNENNGARAIDQLVSRLGESGQKKLGATALRPAGHELADLFLAPLAKDRPPLTPEGRAKADAIMQNRFALRGLPAEDLGFPYDWFRAPRGDLQWPTGLSRHAFLLSLADVYAATGDERYAQRAIAVLLDWVGKFPIGGGGLDWKGSVPGKPASKEGWFINYWDGPWTSLSVARRTRVWLELLPALASAKSMDNRATALLLNSLLGDQPPILIDFPRLETGNQYLAVLDALLQIGLAFPDFKEAGAWRQIGQERLERYASTQVYLDGSWAECAPNYGIDSLIRLDELRNELVRRSFELPPVVTERVRKALRYFAFIADPAGRSPRIAKGGHEVFSDLARLNATYRDPEVAWVVSRGARGQPPQALDYGYDGAGHFVMRGGWGPQDTWIFFEPGPRGSGHADKAQLNFELISRGDVILADPGYYSYSNVGEDNRIARYLDSAQAHNTAVVDGKDQLYRPAGAEKEPNKASGDYHWTDTAEKASAEGAYTYGYGAKGEQPVPVVHSRRLTFIRKADQLEVEDAFKGDGREHRFDVLWQAHPHAKVAVEKKAVVIVTEHTRTRFEFESASPFAITTEVAMRNPYSGWYSETLGDLQPSTTIRVSLRGTGAKLKTIIKIADEKSGMVRVAGTP
jgi:hypothetical protein